MCGLEKKQAHCGLKWQVMATTYEISELMAIMWRLNREIKCHSLSVWTPYLANKEEENVGDSFMRIKIVWGAKQKWGGGGGRGNKCHHAPPPPPGATTVHTVRIQGSLKNRKTNCCKFLNTLPWIILTHKTLIDRNKIYRCRIFSIIIVYFSYRQVSSGFIQGENSSSRSS